MYHLEFKIIFSYSETVQSYFNLPLDVRTTARNNEISFLVNSRELNFSAKSKAASTVSSPKALSKQSLL